MAERQQIQALTERIEKLEQTVEKIGTFCRRLFAGLDGDVKSRIVPGLIDPWHDNPYQ